ncbi:MAG TPA: CHAT domain-containing protein [Terriglobales bacterium]|nr:CHAT domain-containing protein [Terriglobales bacterium]
MRDQLARRSSKLVGRSKKTSGSVGRVGVRAADRRIWAAREASIYKGLLPGDLPLKSLKLRRLQSLAKGRDYTAMMKEVTPALFKRSLRDKTARKALLQVEKRFLREAERLLDKGKYMAAAKLLDRVIRFRGPLRSKAEALRERVAARAKSERLLSRRAKRTGANGEKKKALKKNGGRAQVKKLLPPKVAGTEKGVRKAAKKPERKPDKKKIKKGDASGAKKRVTSLEESVRGGRSTAYVADYPVAKEIVDGNRGNGGGAGGGDGQRRRVEAKEETEVLRRTPHMDLSSGVAPLAPLAEFEVYVSVDTRAARSGEEIQGLELEGPASQKEFQVQVTLVVSGHFESLGEGTQPMTILRSGDSAPVIFKVRCVAEFPAEGNGALSALFKYEGHPCGRVTRHFKIENAKLVFAPAAAASMPTEAGKAAAPIPSALEPKIAAMSGLDPYDLTISVIDTGENDGRHFRLMADSVSTGEQLDVPWTLGEKTDQIVRNYMDRFIAKGLKPTKRLAELKGAGAQLFAATPKEFQQLFWKVIDSGKPLKTIMVVSDEPYIPWELMVPRRTVAGKLVDRSPLGVEFCVGRWIRPDYTSAPQQIRIDRTYVVAPKYVIATKNLRFAPQEAAFVCSNFKPSEQITPADIDQINDALRDKGATLLHFVCHGAASSGSDQTIYLQDMVNNLSSSAVDGLDGFVTGFPRDHTFVFLNACEVGRMTPALVGIGGLPNTFLKLGASGVVAALWSVKDDLAHEVAEKFYKRVIAEPETPFAEILRDIRARAYSGDAEDTYAAYCFYGSPLAKRR